MRTHDATPEAVLPRSRALHGDAHLRLDELGQVVVSSGALFIGSRSGANSVDGVVVRVPSGSYRVVATLDVAGGRPEIVAVSVVLSNTEESSRDTLPDGAFWHEAPGMLPLFHGGTVAISDAALRDGHQGPQWPWDGWMADVIDPALGAAGHAGRAGVAIPYPNREETAVFVAPIAGDVTLFASFDRDGRPCALHAELLRDDAASPPPWVTTTAAPGFEAQSSPAGATMQSGFGGQSSFGGQSEFGGASGLESQPEFGGQPEFGRQPGSGAQPGFGGAGGFGDSGAPRESPSAGFGVSSSIAVPSPSDSALGRTDASIDIDPHDDAPVSAAGLWGDDAPEHDDRGEQRFAQPQADQAFVPGGPEHPAPQHATSQHVPSPVVAADASPVDGDAQRVVADAQAGIAAAEQRDAATAARLLEPVARALAGAQPDAPLSHALGAASLSGAHVVDALVDAYLEAGRTHDALGLLASAVENPSLRGSPLEALHLRRRLGELQVRSGAIDAGISTLRVAKAEADALQQSMPADDEASRFVRNYAAHITFSLAAAELESGNATQAAELAGMAMRSFEAQRLARMAGRSAFVAANAYARLERAEARQQALADAERVFRAGGELDGLGTALGYLGEADASRGEYAAALRKFEEARTSLERAGDLGSAAIAAENEAVCLEYLGDEPAAAQRRALAADLGARAGATGALR